jgi:hypothetical protein
LVAGADFGIFGIRKLVDGLHPAHLPASSAVKKTGRDRTFVTDPAIPHRFERDAVKRQGRFT